MASEIPADIRELASSIVAEIDADWSYDGQAPKDSERRAIDDATTAIAEALLAERERCRLIAAGFDDGGDSGFSQAARTIERIIRQDSTNETEQRNG